MESMSKLVFVVFFMLAVLVCGRNETQVEVRLQISVAQGLLGGHGLGHHFEFGAETGTRVGSGAALGDGVFVVETMVGTPGRLQLLSVDTTLPFTWLHCAPCNSNSGNNNNNNNMNGCSPPPHHSLFNPRSSVSFQSLRCGHPTCARVLGTDHECRSQTLRNTCGFTLPFMDGSYVAGELAHEALRVGGVERHVTLGCAHASRGLLQGGASGALALGTGALTVNRHFGGGGAFSYCLPEYVAAGSRGALCLGQRCPADPPRSHRKIPAAVARLVPTAQGALAVRVAAVRVGKRHVAEAAGVMAVATGTLVTRLAPAAYAALSAAFDAETPAWVPRLPRRTRPLDLCFGVDVANATRVAFPRVTLYVEGRRERGRGRGRGRGVYAVALGRRRALAAVAPGVVCLAVSASGSGSGVEVLGSLLQQRVLVRVDPTRGVMALSPQSRCS